MKTIYSTLLAFVLLSGGASAEKNLSTTLTLGYDSRYVLYGYRLSQHLVHADVYLSLPVSERVTLWGGSWAGSLPDGTYSEVDLYGGVDVQLIGGLYAGVAYSYFYYLEAPWESDDSHEISGHLTWYTGPFSFGVHSLYDSEGEGALTRAVATYDRPLCDRASLSLRAEYGYSFDYYFTGDAPNHALLRADLPIQLTDSVSISPFIAHSLALDAIDSFEDDQFFGGVSVSYSF